jgi:hypothetical protein
MNLRRLTKHVQDQNWFAVALDFLIVVFGVGVTLMSVMLRARELPLVKPLFTGCTTVKTPKINIFIIEYKANALRDQYNVQHSIRT